MSYTTYEPWHEKAACRGMDTRIFFSRDSGSGVSKRARAVCARCPVRPECLADNMNAEYGVFGGTDRYERAKLRRESRVAV